MWKNFGLRFRESISGLKNYDGAGSSEALGTISGCKKSVESGCRLVTKWCFPNGRHKDGEYRITKPDTDNLQKLLKDCMTMCGFWKDDALVASEIVEKFWAEVPGIYIRIEEL